VHVSSEGIRGLLLDVEGTTTPVSFVYDTLFPYARARLAEFVGEGSADPDLGLVRREYDLDQGPGKPGWEGGEREGALTYLRFLMATDRKSTALKEVQGRIWKEGYRRGELRGQVYPDVPPLLERCRAQGVLAAIFSSGSVLAQELLFSSTGAGDLRPFLRAYFDTRTGPKTDPRSYERIGAALGVLCPQLLFASDTPAELEAARGAGLRVVHCVRSGGAGSSFPVIHSFDGILA
jgi:enolase-phosphatase E1